MATMKNPMRSKGPKKTPPTRQQQQAANRPEYESQVPGLIDRAGAEQAQADRGRRAESARYTAQIPGHSQERAVARGAAVGALAGAMAGRMPVPEVLKKKAKVKKKAS